MKKYIILGVLILVIGSMVLIPYFKNNSNKSTDVATELPATFSFKDNLATTYNSVVELEININSEDIDRLELIYNDSIFKTWQQPTKDIKIQINTGFYGIGTKAISLISYKKDGTQFNDNRMVRVLSDILPAIWIAKIKQVFPHNNKHYTQGLEFNEGKLFEGIGQYNASLVCQKELKTGNIVPSKEMNLDDSYFGEGITIFKDQLYQLTWQEQTCIVYNKESFEIIKTIPYIGEGWGLCNDGTSLIMSNGTERITFRNPTTFSIERTIDVYDNEGPIQQLNELEFIDGKIYANVYTTNKVVVIEPETGRVVAIMDGTELEKAGRGFGDVMNGIATNDGKIYMTGKNWNKLFEVTIEKP